MKNSDKRVAVRKKEYQLCDVCTSRDKGIVEIGVHMYRVEWLDFDGGRKGDRT